MIMKCGHQANATMMVDGKQIPACVICECIEPIEAKLDLTDRKMQCGCCGRILPSVESAAFFEYRHNCEFDRFYCGCEGWD